MGLSSVCGIILSVGMWIVARWVRRRLHTAAGPGHAVGGGDHQRAPAGGHPLRAYNRGGRVLDFLLGPAVVALAVPFYRQLDKIKRTSSPRSRAWPWARSPGSYRPWVWPAAGRKLRRRHFAVPKSVTTPIAIGISEKIGGLPSITAVAVIFTGILGGMFAPQAIKLIGVRSRFAIAWRPAPRLNGIGTARALREGELEAP